VIIEEGTVKARLLSSREVGRLMGLPDTFRMPSRYNQAYQVAGDGVAVPVVRYLDEQFFRPFLLISKQRNAA
jgi:DNA (cytosine-5)-methyltransferase 1